MKIKSITRRLTAWLVANPVKGGHNDLTRWRGALRPAPPTPTKPQKIART